jgi:ABC-2 type transport system permease protein
MTFLQQTLGKNYKWWYIVKYGFKTNTVYRGNSLMWLLSNFVMVIGTLTVWYINYANQGNFDNNFSNIFTYFVIGEAFIFSNAIQYDIGENIQDGKLTTKLLRPCNVFGFYVCQAFGYQFFENISKFILYFGIGLILSKFLLLPSTAGFILFIIFCILAYILNTLFGIITGLSAFWFTAFFGSANFVNSIKTVLSGSFFPLNAIGQLTILAILPFAYTFFHPMQIYLGKYSTTEIIYTFLGGIAWCFVLWILARVIFKLGLKKNEAVGL